MLCLGARRQHTRATTYKSPCDFDDLLRALAGAEDYFRVATAKGAMMIDCGKRKLLEGQGAESLDGLLDREAAIGDLMEKLLQMLGVHGRIVSENWL
jgi:hypothetical protein